MLNKIPSIQEILSELVACPSINPGTRTEWSAPYGEAAMAGRVK